MVVNNKVETLAFDVEAGQGPRAKGAPPPAPDSGARQQRPPAGMVVELHKVSAPERRTTARALGQRLAEIFFPDDPLHQFKNQSPARKLVLALQYFFPIFHWGSNYSLRLLRSDAIAGLTIASLAIPQGISYAKLANLPPIIGLYSSFVPPLIYALLGSSRDLAVGPVSIASLVMGSMLREAVAPEQQPIVYLQLAFTATFFAGLFQASLGFLRLGFIVDFLSKATLTGFMGGAAVIVSLQQLKGLLGIVHFTTHMGFVDVMTSVVRRHREWEWQTIVMGVAFLAILLGTRQISARNPRLFWVSAAAPLTSVIASTIISYFCRGHAISIVNRQAPEGSEPSIHEHARLQRLIRRPGRQDRDHDRHPVPHRGDRGGSDVRVDQQLPGGREQGDDGDRGDEHGGVLRLLLRHHGLLLALRRQLQRRVPDGGVQHRDGGGGAGDAAVPDAAVPLHPQRDPVGHHHHRRGRAHRRPRCRQAVEGGQARLLRLRGRLPRRAPGVGAGGAGGGRGDLAVQDPAAGDPAQHRRHGAGPRHAELPQHGAVPRGRARAAVPRRRRRVGHLFCELDVPGGEDHAVSPRGGRARRQGQPLLRPLHRRRHERGDGDRHERVGRAGGAEEGAGQAGDRPGAGEPGGVGDGEDVQLGGRGDVRVGPHLLQRRRGRRGGAVQGAALRLAPSP